MTSDNASGTVSQGLPETDNTVTMGTDTPEYAEDAPASSEEASDEAETTYDEIAEKKGFQSPDDLAKAYQELERHNKQVEMSHADLVKARGETPKEKPKGDENAILASVLKETRELKEKIEVRELFDRHKDAAQYSGKMAEYVKNRPHASWEEAYRYTKFEDLEKANAPAPQTSPAPVVEKSGPKAGKPDIDAMIRDRSVPLSEIEKLLPHGR